MQPTILRQRPARAVVIHAHAHALAALEAAGRLPEAARCQLILLSAPAAAGFLGPGWWAALMAVLRPQMMPAAALDLLDCGYSAGRAMEALRIGLRRLILRPGCPQHAAVLARAAPLGADLLTVRPEALDMARRDAHRQLADWLCHGPAK
jgi:hypothetical protein